MLDYGHWTADQVLRSVFPAEISEITTAFEAIGHIAHMNLRDEQLEYKNLIGQVCNFRCTSELSLTRPFATHVIQVLIDKNPQIKTVVNKMSNIDTTFRFFRMEVLAGEDRFETEVKENGCRFRMDYSKVCAVMCCARLMPLRRCTGTRDCTTSTSALWTCSNLYVVSCT